MLDFSGLEEGKREFSIESHNLDALISKALDTQRFALEKGAFEVDWQGSPKPLIPPTTERRSSAAFTDSMIN